MIRKIIYGTTALCFATFVWAQTVSDSSNPLTREINIDVSDSCAPLPPHPPLPPLAPLPTLPSLAPYPPLPPMDTMKPKNFDDVLRSLENAREHLRREMSDTGKFQQDLRRSMIDISASQKQIEEAIVQMNRNVNVDEIREEMKDMKLSEEEKKKINEELRKVNKMREGDMQKLKEEMRELQEREMPKLREELEKIGPTIRKSLEEADVSIQKAKEEIQTYKNFVDDLHSKGLLNKNAEYSLSIQGQDLFINGKKQSSEVSNAHRAFIEKHDGLRIKKTEGEGLEINKGTKL